MFFQAWVSDVGSYLSQLGTLSLGPYEITSATGLLSTLVWWSMLIALLVCFLCIIWSGLEWQLAGGDKARVQQARERLTHCLIGLGIVATSWAITLILQYFLGLDVFQYSYTPPTPPVHNTPTPVPPTPVPPPCDPANGDADCNDINVCTSDFCVTYGGNYCENNPVASEVNCSDPVTCMEGACNGQGQCIGNQIPLDECCYRSCTGQGDCLAEQVCDPNTNTCMIPCVSGECPEGAYCAQGGTLTCIDGVCVPPPATPTVGPAPVITPVPVQTGPAYFAARFLRATGAPLNGAEVIVLEQGPTSQTQARAWRTTTDANGEMVAGNLSLNPAHYFAYYISNVDATTVRIGVAFGRGLANPNIQWIQTIWTDNLTAVASGTSTVSGKLTYLTTGGLILPAVSSRYYFINVQSHIIYAFLTDSDGNYAVQVPSGNYLLSEDYSDITNVYYNIPYPRAFAPGVVANNNYLFAR
jgi:hypothetical protein